MYSPEKIDPSWASLSRGITTNSSAFAQTGRKRKFALLLFTIRSYTQAIRHLVDIGAPAEKEVIQ
jgi:hypothetical protein